MAANTLASYRRDLRRYVEHLTRRGRVTFGEVAEADVAAFLTALREGDERAPGPRRQLGGAGRLRRPRPAPLRPARGRLPSRPGPRGAPAAPAPPPAQGDQRRRRGTPDRRLAGPADAPLTLRNRALLELLYGTGARISEAVGLAVDDVDLGDGGPAGAACAARAAARGSCPWAGSPARRWAPTWPGPGPSIAAHGRGTPALFLNARGGRLTRQGAWEVLQAAAERAGLNGCLAAHVATFVRNSPPGRGCGR